MKYILMFIAAILIHISAMAQIEVEEFEVQITCNINDLEKLPPVKAKSPAGPVTSEYSELIFSGGCLGTLVRTFDFTDKSGEMVSVSQFVLLQDDTPPVFQNAPATIALNGRSITELERPQVTDNSNKEVAMSYSDKQEGRTTIRTWTAIDVCGNQAQWVQRIGE